MFSACRNCPRSAIQAQEEVLDPCCEPYAQPSPWLSSLDQSKWGLDEQRLITKSFAGCFVLPMEGSQSSLQCGHAQRVANLSRWWTKFAHYIDIWRDVRGITFSWNLWNWFRSWVTETWLDKVVQQEIVFKKRLYSTHLQCIHIIYLLTLFWNNFLNLTFFSSYYTNCELPVLLSDQ